MSDEQFLTRQHARKIRRRIFGVMKTVPDGQSLAAITDRLISVIDNLTLPDEPQEPTAEQIVEQTANPNNPSKDDPERRNAVPRPEEHAEKVVITETWELVSSQEWLHPHGSPLAWRPVTCVGCVWDGDTVYCSPAPGCWTEPPEDTSMSVHIDWQPGDLALCSKERGGPDDLIRVTSKSLEYRYEFAVPTRSQLAVRIPGTEVDVWAWEDEDGLRYECSDIVYGDPEYIRSDFAQNLHLNIVSASQVERHYGGTFPPEE